MEEKQDHSNDEDVVAYLATLQRDQEMEKLSEELKKKRGSESLMDKHTKKLKKKAKEDKDKPVERRPFDREVDLKVNQFDEARKKSMLKKAAQLDNRFSRGGSKFL